MTTTKAKLYTKTKKSNPYMYLGLLDLKANRNVIIEESPVVDIIKGLLPKYYGVSFKKINTKSRQLEIVYIKHHFIALVRETTTISLNSIGAIFDYNGGIHHSSVINSITAWNNLLSYDKEKLRKHEEFKAEIKQMASLIYNHSK